MSSLPTGTVTFLFTDIEGSTRLLQQLGDRYADVLAAHHRLLRSAIQNAHGHEMDAQGDALFVAFPRAKDALLAAVAAQRAVQAHAWPDGITLRVRMGLHTGEPISGETGYVGMDVHRAARICAAGYGGQILVSQTTRDLVENDMPAGVSLRDLGEHRLKDLAHPYRLFQVLAVDLPADFPPLKSLDVLPNNLPVQLTSFVGREREKAEVRILLSGTRLITLTGSGGAGKTRLAIQVAAEVLEEFPNGAWLVELAALSDPSIVPKAVASAIGVPEQPGRSLTETLADALRSKSALVILDNCEHLVAACAHLTDALLRACRNVRILATSREPLGVTGETTWRVPSLSVPDPQRLPPLDGFQEYEAMRLFLDRAVTSEPQFALTSSNAPAVALVCHRLDGIPLAIELAAARVKVLAVEQIAARLNDRFRLLTGGSRTALPRQQTLRAAMDWSHDLLVEKERILFRRLSVFAGGWTLEAAEAVCSGKRLKAHEVLDLLTQLVDKSLVVVEQQHGEARYLLRETVRQYALDRLLESREVTAVRQRHRDWYLALAERAAAELRGPRQGLYLKRLEAEHDNLRAGLEWSVMEADEAEAGLRLAGALQWFWDIRAHFSEGRKWLEGTLSTARHASTSVRAKALSGVGFLAWRQGDLGRAGTALRESLTLWRELGDKWGMAFSLHNLGHVAEVQTDYGRANAHFEESLLLFRELGDKWGIGWSLNCLGHEILGQGDYSRAKPLFEESLALLREAGDKWIGAYPLRNLGVVAGMQGDYQRAMPLLEESLALSREINDKYNIAASQNYLAKMALKLGNHERAMTLYKESLTLRREVASKRGIAECLVGLAGVAGGQGKPTLAARFLGAAELIRETIGVPVPPSDRAEYDSQVSAVRAVLGQERLAAAWAEGRAMTLEQAIEYALVDEAN